MSIDTGHFEHDISRIPGDTLTLILLGYKGYFNLDISIDTGHFEHDISRITRDTLTLLFL